MARGFVAAMVAILLGGCTSSTDGLRDDASTFLRERVEGKLECAFLVSGVWPVVNDEAWMNIGSLNALAAAGLVVRRPPPGGRPGDVELDSGPAATPWIRLKPFTASQEKLPPAPYLCYGRRHVVASNAAESGENGATIRYRYRVEPAPWTSRPDIRTAFPFLGAALTQVHDDAAQGTGKRGLLGRDGWTFETDHPDFFVQRIEGKGFGHCPVPDGRPDSPCT